MNEKARSLVIRIVLLLLFVGFIVVVAAQFTSLRQLLTTLATITWYWLLLALVIQVIYYSAYALLYHFGLQVVGVELPWPRLILVVLVSISLNVIAPLGGVGGAAILTMAAARQGQSGAKAIAGSLLVVALDMATTFPFVVYSVLAISSRRRLQTYEVVGAVLFGLGVLFFLSGLALGRWKPQWLTAGLRRVQDIINHIGGWFRHPELLGKEWADVEAGEFCEASRQVGNRPLRLLAAIAVGLILHPISMVEVYCLFQSLGQPVGVVALITGVTMGVVFNFISITPQGVGAVEGVMTVIFVSLGIPEEIAITTTLIYRAFSIWLPVVIGFILAQRLHIVIGQKLPPMIPEEGEGELEEEEMEKEQKG